MMAAGSCAWTRVPWMIAVMMCAVGVARVQSQPRGVTTDPPGVSSSLSGPMLRRSFSFTIDEDNVQVVHPTDQNYTMGVVFHWGGSEEHKTLEIARRVFDVPFRRWLERSTGGYRHSRRLEGAAYTPHNIGSPDLQVGDRPYAFVIGWTARRAQVPVVTDAVQSSWSSEATIGTVGSPIGHVVQTAIHGALRAVRNTAIPVDPKGWHHQILDSGVGLPTFRYKIQYDRLVGESRGSVSGTKVTTGDLVVRGSGEVGYYTDAAAGFTGRVGWIRTAFWDMEGDPTGAISRAPKEAPRWSRFWSHMQLYAFATGEGSLWAYNELLQGAEILKKSEYVFQPSQIRRGLLAYRTGIVLGWESPGTHSHGFTMSYTPIAGRTREFKGPLARAHAWGGFAIAVHESFPVPGGGSIAGRGAGN
jgi:hypothetical protein